MRAGARRRRGSRGQGLLLCLLVRIESRAHAGVACITSIYPHGIGNTEIIDTVHARRAPMVPLHSALRP